MSFYQIIQNLIKEQQFLQITQILHQLLQKSPYKHILHPQQTIQSPTPLQNLDQFISLPKHYNQNTPLHQQSLINFLTHLSLLPHIHQPHTQNPVTLITSHSAKPLQFP
ncbi:3'-5' exonuclease, partial [Staphylococcus epidermidis]|uniref:3'-5' exonuclease n=1 Tax=Staphylococcus epidermidis TaxID=1282 RepID=UPI0037DA75FD